MKKHEANKIITKANYLLNQVVLLRTPLSTPAFKEEEFLVESFGAAKVYVTTQESNCWYEVWANLKNVSTGKMHKMFLENLMRIFKEDKLLLE